MINTSKFFEVKKDEYQFNDGTTNHNTIVVEIRNNIDVCIWSSKGEIISDGAGNEFPEINQIDQLFPILKNNEIIGFQHADGEIYDINLDFFQEV
jgi:hypothetical protein